MKERGEGVCLGDDGLLRWLIPQTMHLIVRVVNMANGLLSYRSSFEILRSAR